MSHTSPASFLVWAIIATLLGVFLVFHLWSFDRFKCLKWNNGPYSGAFKRVMTYSYLISVPMIMTYSIGFAIIKYNEGYIQMPFMGVVPKPYFLWHPTARAAITPLTLMFSIAWSLEMVTHLEELSFWLFLINAGSAQQDWFRTAYFKTWALGSVIALTYMPLVTTLTRSNPLKCEAYTALAGSLGSLSLTLWFTPILWTFPSFLASLRREGVDTATVVRLTKFHELNCIRVLFRLLFVVPLLILGVDGIRPHVHINESMFGTDFLMMVAGFGCAISSGITLVIFFPRSIENEISAREATRTRRRNKLYGQSSMMDTYSRADSTMGLSRNVRDSNSFGNTAYDSPGEQHMNLSAGKRETMSPGMTPMSPVSLSNHTEVEGADELASLRKLPPMRPNRRIGSDIELGGFGGNTGALTEANVSTHNLRMSKLNPLVHNFTSPIDMVYQPALMQRSNSSRLTFTKP
ncbi:hypothetical protein HGRIS_001910 [Hohenbuehelia grisea]|uniref:Uncharacterized protein n=1 Tax=Hohenbuehelia grisea TaxID=104357 RepID=A0ABR3JJH5_9AGAR